MSEAVERRQEVTPVLYTPDQPSTEGARAGSLAADGMTRDILAAIDEACDDWTVSKDAMRQGKAECTEWKDEEPSVIAHEMVYGYHLGSGICTPIPEYGTIHFVGGS